jgi:hypothetical protein
MNPHLHLKLLMLVSIAFSNTLLASDGHTSPFTLTTKAFVASVKKFDAMNIANGSAKVCACQILNLYSNNRHLENAVVFAERTNQEDAQTDFAKAKSRLEKEKKQLKLLFYDRVNVVAETTAATDCNTLYLQLKKKNANLLMYEVLNADVVVR